MPVRSLSLLLALAGTALAQDGPQLYALYCSACHGADGTGATGGAIDLEGATIALTNLGMVAQGAGWTSANSVVWNCATADLLKLHPRTVKRRIQAGTIPKISGLGRPRIPAKWLDQKLNPNPDE